MDTIRKYFRHVLRGVLAILIGFSVVAVLNYLGKSIQDIIMPTAVDPAGVPITLTAQVFGVIMPFIAGMIAATVIALVFQQSLWIYIFVFGLIALLVDTIILQTQLSEVPFWFKLVIILSIPPQLWIGGTMGLRVKNQIGRC